MLNLYYPSDVWPTVGPSVAKVIEFFRSHETMRLRNGRTFFGTVVDSTFVPSHSLQREGPLHLARPFQRSDARPEDFKDSRARQMTHMPFVTALFTKENLLWIAATAPAAAPSAAQQQSKAQLLLERLWTLHVLGLQGRKFSDSIADEVIRTTAHATPDCISQARLWRTGVMVEMVFPGWHQDTANKLLGELEHEMRRSCVLATALDQPQHVYQFGTRSGDTITVTKVLEPANKYDYTIRPAAVTSVVRLGALTPGSFRVSGDIHRGVCLNTTQAAIAVALGSPGVVAALQSLVDTINTGGAVVTGSTGTSSTSTVSMGATSTVAASLLPVRRASGGGGSAVSGSSTLSAVSSAPTLTQNEQTLQTMVLQDVRELTWLLNARRTRKTSLDKADHPDNGSLLSGI